ncbi:helix-turn-helix transcriptional regulator [Vibrio hyugaensis]|uniref:helix-turn-helix transcriptional regulator n=1 Tax=Vibrio hyugaensis TaxID=1534743 RepID=UPI003DA0C0F4
MSQILTTHEICLMVRRSPSTLYRWWTTGRFPMPLQYNGRTFGWDKESVEQWLRGLSSCVQTHLHDGE